MRKSMLVAAMVLVSAGFRRDAQSIDEPAPTVTTVARVGLAEPFILNRHGDGYGETRVHSIDEPTPTANSQADESRNLSLGGSYEAVQETKTAEPVGASQVDGSRSLSLGASDEAVQETKTAEPVSASQADGSRNLSLGASDEQETKTAEPVRAVDTVWAPMPRGAEAKTTKSTDRPKFTGCPPGVEMSRRSRMKAAASQRRAVSWMARADVRRPHHQGWSAAHIVATLHHYGIYW
jgi:hypothetical protein